jgi:putative lipoic acid-binding regulatory protein
VGAIVRTYDDTLTADRLTARDSRKGNYRSITMQVHVVSEAQLQPMFLELKAVAAVRMVL